MMSDLKTQWKLFEPFTFDAADASLPVLALVNHINDIVAYGEAGFAAMVKASREERMDFGDHTLVPDGNNVLVIQGENVRWLRPCHFFVDNVSLEPRGWFFYLDPFLAEGPLYETEGVPPNQRNEIRALFTDCFARCFKLFLAGSDISTPPTGDHDLNILVRE